MFRVWIRPESEKKGMTFTDKVLEDAGVTYGGYLHATFKRPLTPTRKIRQFDGQMATAIFRFSDELRRPWTVKGFIMVGEIDVYVTPLEGFMLGD